ncbi:MAG: 3-hydroxyacyl-CoA dehydrogenase NAD-binding domain-containing protein [Candidatus Hodarchaeales archaeon]|jgi:enoyl-CoA hydratase/3-hydroxyacyl-CoA dehydrogenase
MKLEDIKHVAVIGAGDMGHGIAEVALMTGYTVSMYDIKEEFVERGKGRIDWSFGKLASKARISESDHEKFMGNLTTTIDIEEAVRNADLVIEAAPEDLELKKKIFRDLDKFAPKHAILATNTSNMSIDEIGAATGRPEKVVGLHYFNPPVMMQLIEIIKGDKTSDETIDVLVDFTNKSVKTPIVCNKDSPGFIVNRINGPTGLFMQLVLDSKEYQPEQIDAAAMNMGMRMGPYELLDFVGLDIAYNSLKYLEQRLDKDFAPPQTIENLVKDGKLGKKTGEGIYKWPETGRPEIDTSEPADFDLMDSMRVQINEAAKILEEGLAGAKDIDTGMKLGMNSPWGPFEMAENTDFEELTTFLDGIADKYGREVFRAHKWIRDGTLMEHATGETPVEEEKKSEWEFDTIEVKKDTDNFVTTIILNRPPMNPFNQELVNDLGSVLDLLWDDKDTRCIVIRGSANCFSVGADLSAGVPDSSWVFVKRVQRGQRVFKKAREIPKPVIAAIERYALGGGLELAMNCDIRIAKKSARIGNPEVRRGLIAAWSATQIMRRHIGLGKTMELILTGEMIEAKRAFKMGLINHVVDDDEFEEKVYEMAKTIATECSPIAVAISKQLVNQSFESSLDAGVLLEALGQGVTFTTKDLQEGFMAFVQKRKPKFKDE